MMSDDALDDSQVVATVLAGKSALFDVLVRRYQRGLFHVALIRLGKRHLADEVVQETFLAAFRYLASYKPQYSFRTWLWTILINQCNRVSTQQQRESSRVSLVDAQASDAAQLVDTGAPPSEQLERQETIAQLHALFAELPELEADALRLRFFAQFQFHEIAAAQGCSLATSKNRVRRALDALSRKLTSAQLPPVSRGNDAK